jgi:hypothetical protein
MVVAAYCVIISTPAYANGKEYDHHEGFEFEDVIVTLGVLTIISMLSTFVMGYFMPKNRKLLFVWHKRAAISTLILAFSHALTVLLFD